MSPAVCRDPKAAASPQVVPLAGHLPARGGGLAERWVFLQL